MRVDKGGYYTGLVPLSEPYVDLIAYQKPTELRVEALASGYTLTTSGFPGGYSPRVNWWPVPPDKYNLNYIWGPSNADAGVYNFTVSTVGRAGGEENLSIRLEAYKYASSNTMLQLFPHVYSGKIDGYFNRDSGIKHAVVAGSSVQIGVILSDDYGQAWIAGDNPTSYAPADAIWKLVLIDSNGTPTSISGQMSTSNKITIDSTALADGQYVVAIDLLDANDLYLYHPWNMILTVDNNSTPITGSQKLAAIGTRGTYCYWNLPGGKYGVDWITVNGVGANKNTVYPYQIATPPTTTGARNALIPTDAWTIEPVMKNYSYREEVDRFHVKTPLGHEYIDGKMWKGDQYYDASQGAFGFDIAKRWIGWDGLRNNNATTALSHYCPDLSNHDFIGVEPSGRVFRLARDGTVTTIFGPRRKNNVVRYHVEDASSGQLDSQLETFIGTYNTVLNEPWDLAFDPLNHNMLYIADMSNHRIAKIDFSQNPPVLSTHAGLAGTSGFVNHATPTSARFKYPISLCFDDSGNLYVSDRGNFAIRKIATNGTVTTVVGQGPSSVPDKTTLQNQIVAAGWHDAFLPSSVTFASNPLIYYPNTIRLDSQGRLIIQEGVVASIRAVNLVSQTVDKCFVTVVPNNGFPDQWMDVDRRGNVGPIDDVLIAEQQVGGNFTRTSIDGTRKSSINNSLFVLNGLPGKGGGTYNSGYGAYGAHALTFAVVIDDASSAIGCISYHRQALAILRPKLTGDIATADVDYGAWTYGQVVAACGTAMSLPFDTLLPGDSNDGSMVAMSLRPSLCNLYGDSGHSFVGDGTTYDDLGVMSNAALAAYIRAGAGGSVPRPELTGKDLAYLIYHIRAFSMAGRFTSTAVSMATINADLVTAGLHNTGDAAAPVISGLTVTTLSATSKRVDWTTNEAAIGIVQYGKKRVLGQYSPIESAYATSHSVTLTDLISGSTYYIRVRQKDLAGNVTLSNEVIS
jgi:hypothetical protein